MMNQFSFSRNSFRYEAILSINQPMKLIEAEIVTLRH